MPPDLRQLFRYSGKATLILCAVACAVSLFIVQGRQWIFCAFAIFYGALCAMLSLYMIALSTRNLSGADAGKKSKGYGSYMLRYLMYAVLLFAGAFAGLPVLGLMAGIAIQKATLVLYARRGGKETE